MNPGSDIRISKSGPEFQDREFELYDLRDEFSVFGIEIHGWFEFQDPHFQIGVLNFSIRRLVVFLIIF